MSPTRSPVPPAPASGPARADDCNIRDLVYRHVERHIGPVARVLHENGSGLVHLDLLVISPTPPLPFTTIVTSGMSARPMTTPFEPSDAGDWQRCELVLGLPADWNGGDLDHWSAATFAPLARLLDSARYPHEQRTWIGPGHTMPLCEPGVRDAGMSSFSAVLIDWPFALAADVGRLDLPGADAVNFYGLYFLTPKELSFKLAKGAEALAKRLADNDVSFVFEPNRKCTTPKRGWLRQVG